MFGDDGRFASGASFALSATSKANAVIELAGAEVELVAGQKDAVVRLEDAYDASDLYSRAYEVVQAGLDMASILGKVDAAIADAEDEHVLWWTEPDGPVVRVVSTVSLAAGAGSVAVVAHDADGNVIPPTPVHPRHSVGFRYFRLAQVTEDLFDAYRNMYLAFEALLSSKYPKTGRGERKWLREALDDARKSIQIADLVGEDSADPVGDLLAQIYTDARLPLFHAKDGEEFYVPHDSVESRDVVSRALSVLTKVVLRMAAVWFDARRMGGGIFLSFLYRSLSGTLKDAELVVSDDQSAFDREEDDLSHPRFESSRRLHTRLSSELQRDDAPAIFGSALKDELNGLEVLRRVDLIDDTKPLVGATFDAEIAIDGVSRLEMLLHVKAFNASEPKSLFRQ